uniref:Uncharacterized protein n=1 Tax=Lactuca sativa TaxID=4236 RepID=A0A9R1WV60_LACSA|nr:hypothetical protein LSAT_V11C900490290 [Lactuca sativa]
MVSIVCLYKLFLHNVILLTSFAFRVAYYVSLSDDGWSPEIFDIISRNTSTSWEKLDVYIESRTNSVFYSTPTVITFCVPTKAPLQAYSIPLLPLEILSDKPRKIIFQL